MQRLERLLEQKFGVDARGLLERERRARRSATTVARSAVIAIIASLLLIMAYVAFRFEPKFAIPVMIALFHDLLITAGVYSLTGREVTTSTVAALLTILGFSLYDTVIVFDRIRENAPRMPRAAFSQIVNRSMSEVLTRSLATSFCTLIAVTALLIFGGETLKDFAFALLVGIASGAYSSIFIASPVLTEWKEREPAYRQRRRRIDRASSATCPPTRSRRRRASTTPSTRAAERPAKPRAAQPAQGRAREPSPSRPVDDDGAGRRRRGRRSELGRGRRRRRTSRTSTRSRHRSAAGARRRAQRAQLQGRARRAQEAARASAAGRKHGRRREGAMNFLVWVMMGIAIWHFAVFVPDRFWGGIVGAFGAAIVGAVVVGLASPAARSTTPASRPRSRRSRAPLLGPRGVLVLRAGAPSSSAQPRLTPERGFRPPAVLASAGDRKAGGALAC